MINKNSKSFEIELYRIKFIYFRRKILLMDDKFSSFIEHMMQNGQDENLELECRFGKYNKLTSNIKPNAVINIYKLYKSRSKIYKYIKDISIGDIRKRTIADDTKNYVKLLFDNPSKIPDNIIKYTKEYKKTKNQPIYLTKEKIFKPIQQENTKVDLVLEKSNLPVSGEPKYQKNKFRCTLKGSWDIDLTIILLEDCTTNALGLFFEAEIEFNYKWIMSKKLTSQQVIEDYSELYNCILTNMDCNKNTPLNVELRYSIFNQVVTLERNYLPTLLNSAYSVTEKADGERVYIQIDNKKNIYRMNPSHIIRIKIKLGSNTKIPIVDTLIDGEIVTINGRLTFLGFDALYYDSIDCRKFNLDVRLKYLKKSVDLLNKVNTGFIFKVKTFYMTNVFINASKIWNARSKMFPYHLDGLVFTPILGAYQSNLPIYKWKDKHSIDVRLLYNNKYDFTEFHTHGMPYIKKGTSEVLNEYTDHKTGNVYYKRKVTADESRYKQLNLVDTRGTLGVPGKLPGAENVANMSEIVELEYEPSKKSWVYLRKRLDKEKPNAFKSIISVLDAISDDITISEIAKMKHIKSEYTKIAENDNKNCYTDAGFNFITSNISSPICGFYTWSYNNILQKAKTILILGCDICILQAAMHNYTNIIIMDPNCLNVYGTQKSEGFTGLKEFININKSTSNRVCIIWGDIDISAGLTAYTKEGQSDINSFIKKNKINDKNKFDTVFINSFTDILYIDKKFNKDKFSKNINMIKSISKNIIGIYLNGTQIIKHLEKQPCLLTKNRELHPLYKIYLNHKNINNTKDFTEIIQKYENMDIFTIKPNDIKLIEIQRMQNSFISQYQPLLFDKNIQNIFTEFKLPSVECKSFKTLYPEYKKINNTINDYDCIIMDITNYFKIKL
jgi:hypothetical protein